MHAAITAKQHVMRFFMAMCTLQQTPRALKAAIWSLSVDYLAACAPPHALRVLDKLAVDASSSCRSVSAFCRQALSAQLLIHWLTLLQRPVRAF